MADDTSRITVKLFGQETSFAYSQQWVGYALLGLRVVMGWIFLYAGYSHITSSGFEKAVQGTLQGAATTAANPFSPLWQWLLNYVGILTPLNAWGLFLVGASLLVGFMLRAAAFSGAFMMLMYWGTSLPLEYNFLVDEHIVYIVLLFGMGAFGAGRLFGVDARLEQLGFVEDHPWLTYLLG